MGLLKSKNAATKKARRSALYVVVQRCPGAEPETSVGKPWKHDEALRIFTGVIAHAPFGFFGPHTGASIRVVAVGDWNKARVAEAVLSS